MYLRGSDAPRSSEVHENITESCCDLHTHSNISDGSETPEQILACAAKMHLCAVALTDHDTCVGLPEFLHAARSFAIEAIPGTELSARYEGHRVHVLAYYVPARCYDQVENYSQELQTSKEKSNSDLADALTRAGYPINYEELKLRSGSRQLKRYDFAVALEERGYMTRHQAAATVLRSRGSGGLYETPYKPNALDTVQFARSLGAVPVLAHPFQNFASQDELHGFLKVAIDAGLQGIEAYYSTFTHDEIDCLKTIARDYGLAVTGGSDFHGSNKPGIQVGVGLGALRVPYRLVDDLAKRRVTKGQDRN